MVYIAELLDWLSYNTGYWLYDSVHFIKYNPYW